MRDILSDVSPSGPGRGTGWGLTMLATVLLSFGVGSTTAAFTLVSAESSPAASLVARDTILQVSGSPVAYERGDMRSADEVADAVADDLDSQSLAPLFAAGALAVLVACARGAARMLAEPRVPEVAAVSAGALLVSATLISAFGLPSLGLRAVAFAICVSMLAARFARIAQRELAPVRA
jgi:hypothetical protein